MTVAAVGRELRQSAEGCGSSGASPCRGSQLGGVAAAAFLHARASVAPRCASAGERNYTNW